MLVGHELLAENFKALIKNGRLAHGYLFFGSDGVGKKTFALALANYLERGDFSSGGGYAPGGESNTGKILSDTLLIQPDENGTIGIAAVREVKNFLYQRPNVSSRRTLIIDNGEALTNEAQNALLKIAEEPPESSLLILIVRELEILSATLGSRLQKIYFATLPTAVVADWLKEKSALRQSLGQANGKSQSAAEIERVAKESMGKPGLAMKLLNDEKFLDLKKQAEKFLKLALLPGGAEKKDFLKNLLDPPAGGGDFNMLDFLDAVALVLAGALRNTDDVRIYGLNARLWHRVLELRKNFSYFPLNPKLQLLNLL